MIDEVSLFFVELSSFPDAYLFLVYTYLLSSVHYFQVVSQIPHLLAQDLNELSPFCLQ